MSDTPTTSAAPARHGHLREVAWVFLKLGTIAFGGPAAHVAMMEAEVVRRRGWVSRQEFLDLYSATNFIPGPNSTEMSIHLGYRRAGWPGLVVGGACFIMPAVLIVTACAWAYGRYGDVPAMRSIFRCVSPVIVAVVAHALWTLGRTALLGPGKGPVLCLIAALAAAAAMLGVNELVILAVAGILAMVAHRGEARTVGAAPPLVLSLAPVAGAATAGAAAGPIFWAFAKIGSVLFGSGYVLLAFLHSEFVERRGWLSERDLLDAVAVGQFTPGPVFTTATFIGYRLDGLPGAGAATAGIFAPAFVFVALTAPILPLLRRSVRLASMLDGLNAASLGLMAAVWVQLLRASITAWPLAVGAAVALVLMVRWRINSAWLVLVAAGVGGAMAWWSSTGGIAP